MGGWKQCCVRNKHIEKEVQEILGQCPECLASPPLSYSTQTKADPTACRYKQGAWGCCHGSRRRNLVMEQICEAWWLTESYLLINMSNTADVYWVSMTLRTPDTPHMICKQIPIKQYLKLLFYCYFYSWCEHLPSVLLLIIQKSFVPPKSRSAHSAGPAFLCRGGFFT